ncbi:MAG: adenylate/guanylate cyclase domain-containing protein [Myxococcales bacterium]|nr:adenylate/guanylate cyclase domain-containing protein [Myxococcales bacterium]
MTAERLATVAAVALGAAWILAGAGPASLARRVDRPVYDLAQRIAVPDVEPDEAITVVVVDDESLVRLGERWPIDRRTWARFLKTVEAYGPAAVMLDVWFETPAPRGEAELALDIADLLRDTMADAPAAEKLATLLDRKAATLDGDRQLAKALADVGRVALGAACLEGADDALDRGRPPGLHPAPGVAAPPEGAVPCPRLSLSLPTLTTAARLSAGITVRTDDDGVARRYGYFFEVDGVAYPSLALAAAQLLRPDDAEALAQRAAGADHGRPGLPFARRGAFRTVRFSDVIEAPADSAPLRDALGGRAVLVGVSALGTEDYARTPLEGELPGIYVHASALAALLADRFVESERALGRWSGLVGVALLLAIAALGWRRESAGVVVGLAIGGVLTWLAFSAYAFRTGAWVNVLPVLLGVGLWLGVRLVFVYRRAADSRRQARAIRRAFQHYLAPAVVEALVQDPDRLRLGGERREITAFFSDVKGFTALAENMEPAELVEVLNEILGTMTEIILDCGGIIDKYIGDAIVAMFGAPLDQPDHAERACRAAARCQDALAEMRARFVAQGRPEVHVRIGLNSGPALVGNMGSERRFEYTMLGDTVNLAARLEGTNAQYGTRILCGEATAARVGAGVVLREVDRVQVKGRSRAVQVYEVVGERAEPVVVARLGRFAAALERYRAGAFAEARAAFEALSAEGDAPSAIFAERAAAYEQAPPPGDWAGVFVMTTK